MKLLRRKKFVLPAIAGIAALVGAGVAYGYFTTHGSGTGSAQVGTPSDLNITQLGTPVYDSTVALPDYTYSQAFNGPQITQFGNEVTLASSSGPLTSAVVAMTMCDGGCTGVNANVIPSYSTSITFNVYAPGNLTTPLTSDTQNITVPAVPINTAAVPFNATFTGFTPSVVLPSTVVYGITLNQLVTDCTSNSSNCGNDPNPVGSLNVNLSAEPTNVSVGSDTNPGSIFISSPQADVSSSALGSNFGYCTGAPATALTTFQEVPVDCTAGYSLEPVGGLPSLIPAVQLNVSGMGDLYPGGPAQPINFSVTNPGSIPVPLTTVTVGIATDANGLVEAVPGETWTDVAGCYASWFTINQAPAINGSVAAGQTWVDSPSGDSIVMPTSASVQDACEGATIGLTFTAS